MANLYTVRILRPCVANRAPRQVGDVVEDVTAEDKIGLVYHNKAEVIDATDSAIIAARKRAAATQPQDEIATETPSKKAAKKAAKKASRKGK